jgi:hypothetical protein
MAESTRRAGARRIERVDGASAQSTIDNRQSTIRSMDWVFLLVIPLAIAGWLGMALLTRNASRKHSGWEAPVPRAPGAKRWWWPF